MGSPTLRLAVRDLSRHAGTWAGAALVAGVVAFFITLEAQFLLDVAHAPVEVFTASGSQGTRDDYLTLGANLLIFSGIPAVIVLAFVLGNVATQTAESHSLWRLGGASPRQVTHIVVVQAVVVSMIGTAAGTAGAYPLVGTTSEWVLRFGRDGSLSMPTADALWLPLVTVAVLAVIAVLAAVLPAARAAHLSPVAVREQSAPSRPSQAYAVACAVVFVVFVLPLPVSLVAVPQVENPILAVIVTLPLGQAAVLTLAMLSPWLLSAFVRAWTGVVSLAGWTPWQVARHLAVARIASSVASITPLMLGIGLLGSLSIVTATTVSLAEDLGGDVNTFETLVLMAPTAVIAAVGSVAVVIMSSRQRAVDVATLRAATATRRDTNLILACESFIGTTSALLYALIPIGLQAGAVLFALRVYDLSPGELRADVVPPLAVLVVGAVGSFVALLWTGQAAWRRPMIAVLGDR